MATEVKLGGDGTFFVGEDKTYRFLVPGVDMTGWTVLFDVRDKDNSPDPARLSVAGTVQGVFDPDPLVNTQHVQVILTDDQTNLFKGSNLPSGAKTYRYSLKRMDDDNETVLVRGDFAPEKATAP